MKLVVFGWGNETRGDDAIGPLLLARLAAAAPPGVTAIEDFQLQIEHALDLEGQDMALFIDAGYQTPAPFFFKEIAPRPHMAHSTHGLQPEAVLEVYRQVTGEEPPPAFILCVRGENFELDDQLSPQGAERVEAAWRFLSERLRDASPSAWRAAIFSPASQS